MRDKQPIDSELSTIVEEEERDIEMNHLRYNDKNAVKNSRIYTNGNTALKRNCKCKCSCGENDNNSTSSKSASLLWRRIWTKKKKKKKDMVDKSNKNNVTIKEKDKTKSLQWFSGWNFLLRSEEAANPTVVHKSSKRVSISVDQDMTDFGGKKVKSTEDEELLEKYKRTPRRGAICEMDESERAGLQRVLTHYVHLKSVNRYGLI